MTGCLVKTFVCEERRRRNCSEADETADMQGKERKEMRNPRNEPPGTGRRFGDLLGGPDFGQPFLTDNYSTALSSSTRLAYSLPTVNSSPFSIRNAPQDGKTFSGAFLMENGLEFTVGKEYASRVLELKAVE